MKKIALLLVFTFLTSLLATQAFNEPKPTFDNPRRWMVRIYDPEIHKVSHTIAGIYNVLKEYPAETLNIVVVVYGPGMRVLKKDYDPLMLTRIKSLMEYDVEFIACKNTMQTMGWTKKDLIDNLSYAQAGIAESIERKVGGWIDVTPY